MGEVLFQRQHRHVHRTDLAAAMTGTIGASQILDDRHGSGQGGDDRKAGRDVHRHLHGRLTDADHRTTGDLTRSTKARVIEAGDDIGVDAAHLTLTNLCEHRRYGHGFVGMPFNAGRA
ncbi:hypothetical protein D9M72_454820 [compost metagenome]